jgi:hypothetical protein
VAPGDSGCEAYADQLAPSLCFPSGRISHPTTLLKSSLVVHHGKLGHPTSATVINGPKGCPRVESAAHSIAVVSGIKRHSRFVPEQTKSPVVKVASSVFKFRRNGGSHVHAQVSHRGRFGDGTCLL